MTERWARIPGYEGYYEVSDHGQVRSVDRVVIHDATGLQQFVPGRTLRANTRGRDPNPKLRVALSRDGRARKFDVHTLVLAAFIGPRPPGTEGCHNDGNGRNNHLGNLRWDTHAANVRDQIKHGSHNCGSRTHCLRGHPLRAPNLRPAYRWRQCLACYRAWLGQQRAGRRGEAFDFDAVAAEEFLAIVRQAGASGPRMEPAPRALTP